MRQRRTPQERLVFTQEFLTPNRRVTIEPRQLLPGTHNYYLGKNPSNWRPGVRGWGEVLYRDIWTGVDLRLYGNGRHLEQEFVVRPGGDPSRIRVAYRGIDGLRIAEDGALVIRTAFGELKESAPAIYQEIDGKRVAVTGRFKLLGPTAYTFEVGPYEPRYALVIDPTLVYATYLGGSLDDNALGIAVDGNGHAYVAGSTHSTNFPTLNGLFPYHGGSDVFVSRLNRTGTALQFSTYVGGSGDDTEPAIAIDAAGAAYVVGSTTSSDLPTLNALQPSPGGGRDAFVFRIDPTGVLGYLTYLGGAGDETGVGIVVDPSCANPALGCGVYVSGTTASASGFLLASGFQPTFGGVRDAFIVKLDVNLAGSTFLAASTYLGGSGAEDAGVLAVGSDGTVYMTGQTSSTNFPKSPNAIQPSLNGPADAFIVKLSADLSTRLYATYFGGSGTDGGNQIVVDSAGNMYVAGQTNSTDLTPVSAVQATPGGDFDGFVLKLDPTGTTVLYLTYLGGPGFDDAFSIALDDAGNAHVTGKTAGSLPTNLALDTSPQPTLGGGGGTGAYAAKLSPSGNQLLYLTYLGGASNEDAGMIAVDAAGSAYVAIGTFASGLPSSFLGAAGAEDAYIVKLGTRSADVSVTKFGNPSPVLSGTNLTYTITVHNAGPDPAINVLLSDTVPAGTTFQSLTTNAVCATPAVNGTGSIDCALGTLANGATVTFALVVKVTAASGSVSNTASIKVLTPDPNSANDSATANVNVTAAGAISGTVCAGAAPPCVAGTNPAIAGATINVRNSDNGFQVATGVTDGAGNYTINGLSPRNYKVSAEANGFATRFFNNQTNFTSATLVTVNAGSTTTGINFGLPLNAGGITGQVTLTDVSSTPVPNAQISVRTAAGDQILFATTDVNGNYNTQRRLAAGSYLLRVSATGFPVTYYVSTNNVATATQIPVAANTDTTGVNVKLASPVGGISGQVTSAATGAPLLGVGISISDGATGGFVQGFTTDATGHYNTGQTLAPGQYKVTAAVAGSETVAYNNKFSVATGDPVTVTAGSTTSGIDLALPLLGAITGHVRSAADSSPIASVTVNVFDYATNATVATTTTGADGSYTINNLNPLQAFRARAFGANFGNVFFNNRPSTGTADPITVPAGATTTIDFALPAARGIQGQITDATTGLPIQGVQAIISDGASTNQSINNGVNFSATTDASGNFNTGRNLAPGVYKVTARKFNSGYIQSLYTTGATPSFDPSTAATVTVTALADTLNVNIAMQMGGAITGVIRDRASGQPISGANVSVIRVGSSGFFGDFSVTTDPNGNYTITGLHTGEWLVFSQATGHMFGWYSGDPNSLAPDFGASLPVQITGANTVNNVNLNLAPGGGEIRGRVTRSDNGLPVTAGTFVRLRPSWPPGGTVVNFSSQTTAQGDYSIPGIPPGRYVVEADRFQIPNGTAIGFFPFGSVSRSTGVPVAVTDGGVATADFQVYGFSGNATPRSISGTLRDTTTAPIRNAYVVASQPTALSAMRVVGAFDDGSFVLDGLAPGRYLINATTEKTFVTTVYPSELTRETGSLIDVTAGDVSGINLVLPTNAGTITGTITRSDNGQPLLGAIISVRTFLDPPSAGGGAVASAAPESRVDGAYLVRGVAPGFYKIRVSAPGFVTKYFSVNVPGGAGTLEDGSFVDVAAGANTPSINVALDPTSAVLTGTVKRQGTLEAVVAAVVAIHDAATGNRMTTATTDASGTWRSEDLAAGSYTVEVFDVRDARYAAQWYSGKSTSLSADPITVAASGVTSGIDFLVAPSQGSISGRVFMSNGTTPLPNAAVEILDAATGGHVRRALTSSDGRYSAQGLAPGTSLYVAHALDLGFPDQYYNGVTTRAAATPLTVATGADTPNINFTLTQKSADVSVTMFANPSPVLSGSTLTYTINVRNNGSVSADSVTLTDAIPTGTTFQSVSPALCATPAVNGTGTVSCSLGALAGGASVTLALVVNVTSASGSLSNTAVVATSDSDPSAANNSVTVVTNITTVGTISGAVCANALPPCGVGNPGIAGAIITVFYSDSPAQVATGITDGSGNYTISGLYPRGYRVSAQANGFTTRFFNGQVGFTSANAITVNPSATTGVNFGLPGNAGAITGRVTFTDGVTVTPVANATINVRTTGGDIVLNTTTDGSGNYNTQRRLAAASYLVRATSAGLVATYYANATSAATATPVPVSANADTPNINIQLSSGVGGISGQITNAATGAPLANAGVFVSDGATSGIANTYLTDASGRFDTGQSLKAGVYKVNANAAGFENTAYNNRFSAATGDPVTVTTGATTPSIDIALPALGAITGHVRDAVTGLGIVGAIISVDDYASNANIANITVASSGDVGSYTISNLNPLQAYKVRVRATNYGFSFFNNKTSAGTADVVTIPAGAAATVDFALTANGGGIVGTVRDAVTLAPIPFANVDIIDGASTNLSINNFTDHFVTADASGNFNTLRIWAPGVYKLRARLLGSGYIHTFSGGGLDLSTAATVTVTAAHDTTSVDTPNVIISMQRGGTITGTIRDRASGQPISGSTVNVRRVAAGTFFGDFSVTTNANGIYTITGLHPGEWLVSAQAAGHVFAWYSGDPNNLGTDFSTSLPIQITGSSTVSTVDFNLQPGGGEIRGRVTRNDNGQPVSPGTQINIRGPWPRTSSVSPTAALTNEQGDFSVSGLPAGRYIVEADRFQLPNGTAIGFFPFGSVSRSSGVPVTVTDGSVVTTDFQVLGFTGNATPRSIRGTLRDPSNNPIRAARVFAVEPNGTGAIRFPDVFDDGSFVVDGLPPGRYALSVQIENTFAWVNYPAELTLNTATLIDLTAGDVSGVNFVLPNNAGTITGIVTRSDNGQPILGASIGVRTFLDSGVNGATSRIDGTFLVRGVVPGFYKIRVSAPGFVTKFFKIGVPGGGLTLDDGSFVQVTGGTNFALPNNIVLDPTGGALTGTVRDRDTLQPVVATVVVIHDAATGNRVTAVSTDATGTWRTEGLGPGTYKVAAVDVQAARHATQWYSGEGTLLTADPVTVASVGVTGGIDMLVSANRGSISGQVSKSDATPLANAVVAILDSATGGLVRRALVGSTGAYLAEGLAPGSNLYVAQGRALGFADEFFPNVPSRTAATPLTVVNGGSTANVNLTMTASADITGSVSYSGAQTGALVVRLFSDDAFTQQVYETVIPSASFGGLGQAYSFALPAPDTRGLLPGTYFVKAFLDSDGNGLQDVTEAVGTLAGSVTLAEGTTAGGVNFSIADPPATTNTPPVAEPQSVIFVQGSTNNLITLTGQDAQTPTANLTYAVFTNPQHGTLATTGMPQERLYTPNPSSFSGTDTFTFTVTDRGNPDNCGAPSPTCSAPLTSAAATVNIQVSANVGTTSTALSNPAISAPSVGSAIGDVQIAENATGVLTTGSPITLSLPAGLSFRGTPTISFKTSNGAVLNPPTVSAGTVSFTLAVASATGPASILVSGMSVDVPSGFLADGVTSAALLTTISGANPGLTAASVQNATILGATAGPAITNVSPGTAARGVTNRVVVIAGANFANDATASFGPGVAATVSVDGPSQITATLSVAPSAPLGPRDLNVTNVSAGQSATKPSAFEITAPPTVTGASGPLVHCDNQLVTITGTGFAPPTTTPSDLLVNFSGAGITVVSVGYTSATAIAAIVNAATAVEGTSNVTVTNSDGGSATGVGVVSVGPDSCQAAPPSKNTSPPPPPPPPTISSLSTGSGPIGSSVTINGSGFGSAPSVTFAGVNGTGVTASLTAFTSSSITAIVPQQSKTGNVTVTASSLVSNGVTFAVTTPVLAAVLPGSVTTDPSAVKLVPLALSGSRFTPGAIVSFSGPAGDVTQVGSPTVSPDGTTITLTVSIPPVLQQPGSRDVTVTNPGVCSSPAPAGCLSSTLLGALQVQPPPVAIFTIALPDFADSSTYLPSVTQVSLTRLATGACDPTTKVITPASVRLQARFMSSTGLTPPASVTFTIAPSAIPGTATNEDCELDPANPTKDFSIGIANLASQQVVVPDSGGGVYDTMLFSYDWGGKVTVTVTGTTGNVSATASKLFPVDADGDDLPDAYEKNAPLNTGVTGANVLDFQNPDQNGNGIKDRDDRFAKDGLSNFEKYRGVYTIGPTAASSGALGGFQRLGAGLRHLFVRGRGFRNDPAVPAGFCGINPATGAPVADPTLSTTNPCPIFLPGPAFLSIGVAVHDVSGSFTGSTELPRTSLLNPTQPTLDMATVVYDGVNCKGSEPCDTISKFGVRQWGNSTLGYTTPNGTATTYGSSTIYKRAIECYFNCRPYQHRTNDPARVVKAPDGTPMLAPVTLVGDSGGSGTDNGLADVGEATISGQLAGDTYIPGSFNQQLNALDVNNDGCIELPTAADPTTLARCTPNADTAAVPSATKQQVVRTVVTHELGHTLAIAIHTSDPTDIMYQSTINFIRDGHFSDTAAGLVQIHNKGIQ